MNISFSQKNRLILFCAITILVLTSLGIKPAHADTAGNRGDTGGNTTTFTLQNPLKNVTSVGGLVNKFVEIFSYLVIIFAVIAIVFTGLQLILARGNPEKMKEASTRLGYILIGVAIVIGARIMVAVIINTLEATGTVNQNVIQGANRALDGR
ncbi:MAG: TrbC/VirB2 family protein [Patescibacteria group bacterium]